MTYIVCGFYTPSYKGWADGLVATLRQFHVPFDIVQVPELSDWETATLIKARQIQEAMTRNPDSVVVYLDVDSTVHGDLSPLEHLSADVAVYMKSRVRRSGWHNGRYTMHAIARTIVFKPNAGARAFVAKWIEHSEGALLGDVDQTFFLTAMAASTGTSFQPLDWKWSATRAQPGIITHDNASKDTAKVTRIDRWLGRKRA